MRWNYVWPLLLLAGCDQGEPPFDELPLRDALRAAPAVLANLSDPTRARLASRLEAARAGDTTVDHFSEELAASRALVVGTMDRARQARQAAPLLLGVIQNGAAWAIGGDDDPSGAALPPMEGVVATSTADLEARALAGHAGVELRILIAASGAHRLERVVGWPSGAVAIDDTLYVNASWLVALARTEPDGLDGGVLDTGLSVQGQAPRFLGPAATAPGGLPTAAAPSSVEDVTGAVAHETRFYGDAGAAPATPTAPSSETSQQSPAGDACASDSGCENASEDTSDAEDDDCASSDESSDASCASESGGADVGEMDSGGCQMVPRPRPPKKKGSPLSAWLLAPLGYLFHRRRP